MGLFTMAAFNWQLSGVSACLSCMAIVGDTLGFY